MNWKDKETYLEIYPPHEFNFEECLLYLGRSKLEETHQIKEGFLYKLIKVDHSFILCRIGWGNCSLNIEFPIRPPSIDLRQKVVAYIWEWLDFDQELKGFYQLAAQDQVLQTLVHKYYGLRIVCIPDLFEALVWAIMGQQINLTFAYTLKKRFTEKYGESLNFEGDTFWLFPTFEKIASLHIDDLRELQFTQRKAEYIIDIAKAMVNGDLNKVRLLQGKKDFQQIRKSLMKIRGIGPWTADYVLMRCLHYADAFPIADVGLHNALKKQLGLEKKPSIEEIEAFAEHWKGWKAYATFYLWRSLYDEDL